MPKTTISHTLNVAETDQPAVRSHWLTGGRPSTGVSEKAKAAAEEAISKAAEIRDVTFTMPFQV